MHHASDFFATFYIAAPAETVWQAITDAQIVDRYFLAPVGKIELQIDGVIFYGRDEERVIDGKIIEIELGHRLAHSFAFGHRPDEPPSRVIYEIEAMGQMCALRLTHTGLENAPATAADVRGGWPQILSGLKTWLETGRALPWPRPSIASPPAEPSS